jgi:hypothetical protein
MPLRLRIRFRLQQSFAYFLLRRIPCLVSHRWELRQSVPDRLAAVLYDDPQLSKWHEVCRRCEKARPVRNQTTGSSQSQDQN